MSFNRPWHSSQDEIELDLDLPRTALRSRWTTRSWRWICQHRSTLVVLWVLLISEAVRGILIPTQANFVKFTGGDETFAGLTVGAFSGGRLAMTVLLGFLSGLLSYKIMFIATTVLLIVSNLGYALAGVTHSKWLIFFARIGLGLGAGTLSLVRGYFAECYDEVHRTTVLTVAAAVQYGGFALLPGLGDILALITDRLGWNVDEALLNDNQVNLVMNEFTAPAWLMMAFNFISLIGLFLAFSEPPHKPFEIADLIPFYQPYHHRFGGGTIRESILKAFGWPSHSFSLQNTLKSSSDENSQSMIELDGIGSSSQGKDEAMSSRGPSFELHPDGRISFSDDSKTGKSEEDEESEIGLIEDEKNANQNGDEVSYLTSSEPDENGSHHDKSQERMVMIIWLAFLFINFLIRVVLGTVEVLGASLYDIVTLKYIPVGQESFHPSSGTFYTLLGLVGLAVVVVLAIFAKRLRDEIPFIISLAALLFGSLILIANPNNMSLVQFTIGSGLLYSIGYPLAQSVVVSMFSKIPASKHNQAISMSWIGSSGSIGRIIGPIMISAIFQRHGAPLTFIFNASISAFLLIISVITIWYMQKIKH